MPLKVVVAKKGEKHPSPSIMGVYVKGLPVQPLINERQRIIDKWTYENGGSIDERWVKSNMNYPTHILDDDAVIIVWEQWGAENEFGVETP